MPGERPFGVDVDDVDDGAAGARKMRRRGLGEEQRRTRVGSEELVPVPCRYAAKRGRAEGRSIVDQSVEPAEACDHGRGEARQCPEFREVRLQGQRAAGARLLEPAEQLVELRARVAAVQRQVEARRMQGACDRRAHPAGGAGHQHDGTWMGCAHLGSPLLSAMLRVPEHAAAARRRPALHAPLPEPGADERAHSDALVARIDEEIAARGPLPFSRYMELALYAPGLGYYSAGRRKFGAAGDFVTAPELGSLFARAIALACRPTLVALGPQADFVELGGGSGAFAVAALAELATRGCLPHRYRILEPSAELRERQRERVARELPTELAARVEWILAPPEEAWKGVLFANEVIDALPTTRFTLDAGEVFEEHVAIVDGRLARVDRPADALVAGAVRHLERELGATFAEGYRSEVLPQLPWWLAAVSASLERGLALFIDYGHPRREYYLPERSDGTLVCHYRHRAHGDPFLWPGLQDLTAFVEFTALAEAGTAAGLDFAGYAAQGRFLLAAGLPELLEDTAELPTAARLALLAEAKRLTLPDDMGERFQVMAFSRALEDAIPALDACDLSHRL